MTFLASISLCTHTSLFASLCGRGRVHTEIPSLSRFDEALADPAYCVCSELPAQCGVVCAGELPSGPDLLWVRTRVFIWSQSHGTNSQHTTWG